MFKDYLDNPRLGDEADDTQRAPTPDGVYDPTNFAIRDGGLVYYPSTGSGKSGVFLNSRWNFKIDGMVQLPAGINLAGKLSGREGFIFPRSFRAPNRAGGLGRTEVFLDPIGDSRLDDLWVADLRVEKVFNVGHGRLSGMMDVFNLFDASTVLGRERRQNLTTARRVQDISVGARGEVWGDGEFLRPASFPAAGEAAGSTAAKRVSLRSF